MGLDTQDLILISPRKSEPGEPCSGCGFCCQAEACLVSERLGHYEAPCVFLEWDGGRYRCGVLLQAKGESRRYLIETMAVGLGCDTGWIGPCPPRPDGLKVRDGS